MRLEYALFLGLVQGVSEFLPVSSSGHLVIFKHLFNLSETPLLFDVLLHLGTLLAVLVFFWRDFWRLLRRPRIWLLLIVGSLPAGVVGVGMEIGISRISGASGGLGMEMIFSSLLVTGLGFLVTAGLLLVVSRGRHKVSQLQMDREEGAIASGDLQDDRVSLAGAFKIGLFQALAILPGISRSGATIVGGVLTGLTREEAFTFSFLLAVPAILGAVVTEGLGGSGGLGGFRGEYIWGVVLAAAVGYGALRVLRRVVVSGRLGVFAFYTFVLGLVCVGSAIRDRQLRGSEAVPTTRRDVQLNVSTQGFGSTLGKVEIPEFSLETVFQKDHSWVNNLPEDRTVTLAATGDVGLGRTVNTRMISQGVNYPFLKTADFLHRVDITMINLESPLIDNCIPTDAGMVFCGRAESADALTFAGVDVVNLATNHIGNYGTEGVKATRDLLEGKGLLTFGSVLKPIAVGGAVSDVGALHATPVREVGAVSKEINGTNFVFLGWEVLGGGNEEEAAKDIKMAREYGRSPRRPPLQEFYVCNFHWGDEYTLYPSVVQKNLAHLAIDSGCDLIIGNHPHWVQATEIYNGKFIAYSHGNFIFDQMWSRETREGVVGVYTIYDDKLVDVEFKPVLIEDYCQPRWLDGADARVVLERMAEASAKIGE